MLCLQKSPVIFQGASGFFRDQAIVLNEDFLGTSILASFGSYG